jgi:hypothetical protein
MKAIIEPAPQSILDALSSEYDEDLKLTKGWVVNNHGYDLDDELVIVRCKDLFPDDLNNENLMIYGNNFNFGGYIYPSEPLYKQIMSWELKHKLTPSTKETFGGLIDEL